MIWLSTIVAGLLFCLAKFAPALAEKVLYLFFFVVVVFVGVFVFFAAKNPDLLRSEEWELEKRRIEQSKIGDDSAGWGTPQSSSMLIPTSPQAQLELNSSPEEGE